MSILEVYITKHANHNTSWDFNERRRATVSRKAQTERRDTSQKFTVNDEYVPARSFSPLVAHLIYLLHFTVFVTTTKLKRVRCMRIPSCQKKRAVGGIDVARRFREALAFGFYNHPYRFNHDLGTEPSCLQVRHVSPGPVVHSVSL